MDFKMSTDGILEKYSGWEDTVVIPEGTVKIQSYAFGWKESLTTVYIPDSVVEICEGAFQGCTELTTVQVPKNIKRIEKSTFEDCSALTHISLPPQLIAIEADAFSGCSSLTELQFPDSLREIGEYAFANCESLSKVFFPKAIQRIADNAFSNTMVYDLAAEEGRMRYYHISLSEFVVPFVGQIISVPMVYSYYCGFSDMHGKQFRLAVGELPEEMYFLDCVHVGSQSDDLVKVMKIEHFIFSEWMNAQTLPCMPQARLTNMEKHLGEAGSGFWFYSNNNWTIRIESLGGGDLRYEDYIYCDRNGIDHLIFSKDNWDIITYPKDCILGSRIQRAHLYKSHLLFEKEAPYNYRAKKNGLSFARFGYILYIADYEGDAEELDLRSEVALLPSPYNNLSHVAIGPCAFENCASLKSLILPQGCYIYEYAFCGCSEELRLKSDLPDNEYNRTILDRCRRFTNEGRPVNLTCNTIQHIHCMR